ncbi:site-specific integrase [Micromonospora sp. KC721]|uniref:site-specific integrase n=1 Tax=Micromonospora sp. KC721 TaxID=2530380 RepID=UPI001A9E08E7|nr:site-specific integrase [Micromonospora sp. KC721]
MTVDKTTVTVRVAVDRFLASAHCRVPTTRRSYGSVLDRLADHVGADRYLGDVTGDELADTLTALWGQSAASTWNQRRAAIANWSAWCTRNGYPAPDLPAAAERQTERHDATRSIDRAAIERLLTRRDVPLREKTLWRMLYETTARAAEILALDIANLELDARPRTCCPGSCAAAPPARSSCPNAAPARPADLRPKTSARTPAAPVSATTGPASCSTTTPAPTPRPAGTCTSYATARPPTSATPTPAYN